MAKAAESKEGELQAMLEQAEQQWQTERQSLVREVWSYSGWVFSVRRYRIVAVQIQCLRMSSTQDGDEFQRREQSLRWEIAQLHKVCSLFPGFALV